MNSLNEIIAGEITLSENPGGTMKKWRELFNISQIELAKYLKLSASTISDYESNRRQSPGVNVVKRLVTALLEIDAQKGGSVTKNLEKLVAPQNQESEQAPYKIHDFSAPLTGIDFARIIDAKIIANPNYLDPIKIFGYTILDSLRVIVELPISDYPKLFGSTTERVFIFDQVSTGRSPMVVIRVAPIKPRIVTMCNLDSVDKLAIKIAQVEKIPLLTTKLSVAEIEERLSKV
ncbi:MAG: helix-turn-helix domain-containing protein [Candidatus Micrarchaeaceae archaeon]